MSIVFQCFASPSLGLPLPKAHTSSRPQLGKVFLPENHYILFAKAFHAVPLAPLIPLMDPPSLLKAEKWEMSFRASAPHWGQFSGSPADSKERRFSKRWSQELHPYSYSGITSSH